MRPHGSRKQKSSSSSWFARVSFWEPIMAELDNDEQFYRDTESIAFPKLDDRQLAMLEPLGARRVLRRGEMLFKAGQRYLGLTVILHGEFVVIAAHDCTNHNLRHLNNP